MIIWYYDNNWNEFPETIPPFWSDVMLKMKDNKIVNDEFLDCYFGFVNLEHNIKDITHWTNLHYIEVEI